MSLLFVLFHDGSRRNFFGAAPVSATLLRTFFDVFVLTLLFVADATQMVISRHIDPPVGIQQARYQAKEHFVDSTLGAPVAAQLARPIPSRGQRGQLRHANDSRDS